MAIKINRFASRISVLTDIPYEHSSRTVKAMLILMAQMQPREVTLLLRRYKKFKGNVPYDLDKVHE